MKKILTLAICLAALSARAQDAGLWNHKQCAVVLTYDDAINVDLDNVLPVLDSLDLKATFYLIGSSPVVAARMQQWRAAAQHGHELGNHSLFHPCDGSLPGRSFVTADHDLSKYTVNRAVEEVRATNTLLNAIDGKTKRTFAYPCGDLTIGGSPFYTGLQKDFVAARGVRPAMDSIGGVDLDNVNCYGMNGQTAEQMIDLVKQAMKTHTLLVFLFHGVGGGHNLNVGLTEHSRLVHFLKDHEKEILIAPMVVVAEYIQKQQEPHKDKDGFVRIFDGKTLNNWAGDTTYWRVEDGCLVGEVTPQTLLKRNSFIIWQGTMPQDFEIRVEYKISAKGNSGINYRSEKIEGVPNALRGYQADLNGPNTYTGSNYEERKRTTLASQGEKTIIPPIQVLPDSLQAHIANNQWVPKQVVASLGDTATLKAAIKKDDWNEYRIVVRGNRMQHYINGVLMSDVTDNDTVNRRFSGYLGVQVHVGPPMRIAYRNFRMKELK